MHIILFIKILLLTIPLVNVNNNNNNYYYYNIQRIK